MRSEPTRWPGLGSEAAQPFSSSPPLQSDRGIAYLTTEFLRCVIEVGRCDAYRYGRCSTEGSSPSGGWHLPVVELGDPAGLVQTVMWKGLSPNALSGVRAFAKAEVTIVSGS